eukprot:TCONS_00021941-protein
MFLKTNIVCAIWCTMRSVTGTLQILASFYLIINIVKTEDFDKVHMTNSWAVHIENGNNEIADQVAEKHGFSNVGQIGSLPGYFHFVHKKTGKRSRRKRRDVTENKTFTLLEDDKVKWVERQHVLERDKRGVVPEYIPTTHAEGYIIRDPLFSEQWYLNNVGQSNGPSTLDINVLPVWSRGISGKNVVVAILDDGVDHTHPDLKANYDPRASYDFVDYDNDPRPRDSDPNNCHGTKCAGEVAAEAGNDICGVGVAFNSSIAGIRMLDGNVTDTIEGSALSYKKDYIDIYSCAWGPKDDGKRFGRPGTLASKALELGVKEGRQGLGSIFVWATGNGGLTDDDCNCDGYTTSVYTISIGAISDHGLSTYYTESCSSTLGVTFSGGSHREKKENKIITTTLHHECTDEFKGTSSAAPLAAGMIALMLEANSKLGWRDVQHIIVETALMTSPLDEGWRRNGAGKWFNQKFGFGRLDASAMVDRANNWRNVGEQRACWGDTSVGPWDIPDSGTLLTSSNATACEGSNSAVKTLEHVQVIITLRHRHRGHVSIELISPSGTRTRLLKTRRNDKSTKGLKDWIFMSVHFWGEDPHGIWTLAITDNSHNNRQHHRYKSRFGDTEDATEILHDEMNGEAHGEDFNTAEQFEDSVFKDDSFKKKRKDTPPKSMNILNALKQAKAKRIHERNSKKIHKEHHKIKIKGPSHAKNVTNEGKSDATENDVEAKILEEILGSTQTRDSSNPSSGIMNSTLSMPSQKPPNTTLSGSHSHNETLNSMVNATQETPPHEETSTSSQGQESTGGDSETKMLESLLRNVISQVFSNFLNTNNEGSKSFEERISLLEKLLGKKPEEEDDPVISGLMNAFKKGKAIDRVNNVLNILQDSKNNTKFTNTSFERNADVVVDVLKVLKDVLNTGKGDTHMKNYKERVSDLLEKQSGNTEKLTKKLLTDLKQSGTDSSDVVNDALALISRIFQSEKMKSNKRNKHPKITKNAGKSPHKYRIMFEGPNSEIELPYSSIKNMFAAANGNNQKEITKTKQTKEIQHDANDVEKITVERVKVKDHPPSSSSGKRYPTYSTTVRNSMQNTDSSLEMPFPDEGREAPVKSSVPDGFTLTIEKNGETVGEQKVNNEQAIRMLQSKDSTQSIADLETGDKKHSIKNKAANNIDVEVIVDGREDPAKAKAKTKDKIDDKPKTIKLQLDNNLIPQSVSYDAAKKKTHVTNSSKAKSKKSHSSGAKKKTLGKKGKHVTRNNATLAAVQERKPEEEEPIFPFLTFNENEQNFPGNLGENFVPSFNANEFPSFEYPYLPIPPAYSSNEKASFTQHHNNGNFEAPVRNPSFSIDKRSRLMSYGDYNRMPWPYYPFVQPTRSSSVPLVRNYRSTRNDDEDLPNNNDNFDTFDEEWEENAKRMKRHLDDNDEFDFFDSDNEKFKDRPVDNFSLNGKQKRHANDELFEVEGYRNDINHVFSSRRSSTEEPAHNEPEHEDNKGLHSRKTRSHHGQLRHDKDILRQFNHKNENTRRQKRETLSDDDDDVSEVVKHDESELTQLLHDSTPTVESHHSRRHRRSLDDEKADTNNDDKIDKSKVAQILHDFTRSVKSTDIKDEAGQSRQKRSLVNDDSNASLIRQKRNEIDDNDDYDNNDDDDDEGQGPHVVKRSAIFGQTQPDYVMTTSEKRSAIRKALALEKSLKKKLFSMKKESSSALDIIKRVHTDISNADAKDLRMLEKELSNMGASATDSNNEEMHDSSVASSERNAEDSSEPINNFIKLVEQTENSSTRKTIPPTSDEGRKQSSEEYYKYGTSASGVLVSWTIRFYGT